MDKKWGYQARETKKWKKRSALGKWGKSKARVEVLRLCFTGVGQYILCFAVCKKPVGSWEVRQVANY